ncbi:MAG: UDP-N-acetylglucosamine 2-epimerase, partial [Magnetospiraceae bacterium]
FGRGCLLAGACCLEGEEERSGGCGCEQRVRHSQLVPRFCQGLACLAARDDVEILYPVHLNPNVQAAAQKILAGHGNVHLIPPQEYRTFVYLMTRSHIIVTDSGGVQEEAPSLGKPVLVTRDTTERPEAVKAGTVELVGTDTDLLVDRVTSLLDDPGMYERMSRAINPYGDGQACARIVESFLNASV